MSNGCSLCLGLSWEGGQKKRSESIPLDFQLDRLLPYEIKVLVVDALLEKNDV